MGRGAEGLGRQQVIDRVDQEGTVHGLFHVPVEVVESLAHPVLGQSSVNDDFYVRLLAPEARGDVQATDPRHRDVEHGYREIAEVGGLERRVSVDDGDQM